MTQDPKRLWAKSKPEHKELHPSMFLLQHLKDVQAAAERVLETTGADQLHALGLAPAEYLDRLRRCVVLAAMLHDVGKANDHFQGMLLGTRAGLQQGIRHEWVTILIARMIRKSLLKQIDERDLSVVEWAIAGHHPSDRHESPPKRSADGSGADLTLRLSEPDFAAILNWLKAELPESFESKRSLAGSSSLFHEIAKWSRSASQQWEQFSRRERCFVAAVKNSLIAADIAGSTLPKVKTEGDSWDWITQSFQAKPAASELDEIVKHRLKGGEPRPFQREVAGSEARVTFVKAGCGTGKTLAAYMWARDRWPGRRLYFCYPTTGTATEGFKDYLFPPESENEDTDSDQARKVREIGARLFHSRREVDNEIILHTGPDTKFSEAELAARLDSLEAWATPIVACTVDTVLGLVQNNRRGLFAWPALAGAAFIFDEIHAYDDRLFGALLRFLRDLPGLPVLLMTASLPAPREAALRNTLEGRGIQLNPIAGPKELEDLPRYHKLETSGDELDEVKRVCDAGGKVLWVCNTVARVMDAADRAAARGLTPLIYHSRFKYEHRVQRHKAVIDAFHRNGPALAICSQVAEMSLDLSADLLVTDLAPVPALIQRLGRLNRKTIEKNGIVTTVDGKTRPFIVVNSGEIAPYIGLKDEPDPENWPEIAKQWYAILPAEGISQAALSAAWQHHTSAWDYEKYMESAWLDGGPKTSVKELRQGITGISILMLADVDKVRKNPKQTGRYVLPMPMPPKSMDRRKWPPPERGLPIAPPDTIDYDEMRGAKWIS
jgi:CRISPR-associated endonuclease/helicase Cas3